MPKPPVAAPKAKGYVVPKPPTMPIITGVTLKSVNARPKSSPPMTQADPRDQLLESIRNFGGREKLRSVSIIHYSHIPTAIFSVNDL